MVANNNSYNQVTMNNIIKNKTYVTYTALCNKFIAINKYDYLW